MQNLLKIIPLFLLFTACQQKVDPTDITKLNGYWEIEKVLLPDETEKEYGINLTYDYIELGKDNKGFRKKVTPQLNGKFLVDDGSEALEVVTEKEKIYIKYTTPYSVWKEELKSISDEKLEIINADNKTYIYKRAAINL